MSFLLSSNNMSGIMPWNTNDKRELEGSINSLALHADHSNRRWAQKWFENFQFVLGNHNLRWSKQFDIAIDADSLRGGAPRQETAQTNISRTVLESLSSMIYSQLGELIFENRYDATSRGARLAKILESLADAYNDRLNLHDEFDVGSVIYVMYSKVFGKVSWNRNAGGVFKRPRQQVVEVPKMTTRLESDPVTGEMVTVPVPVIGEDGQPIMIQAFEDVVGPDGHRLFETVRNGDACVDMLTPYEVCYDPMAKSFNKARWVQQNRVMDYDEFMTEYASEEGVILEEIDKVRGGSINSSIKSMAVRHFLRSSFATPPTLDFMGQMNLTSMLMLKNKVFVVEHYDRPSEGHRGNQTPWLKEGRRAVLANGRLCLVSTPQYRTNKQNGWHPFLEAKWLPLPPSSESSGPMSDTVQKNRELNLTDTLMSLALKRQAGSTLLVNENAGLDKNKFTGEPGLSVYVTGDPNGAAAWLSDKNPLPSLVHAYRRDVKDEVYEISGAQDSIRGERSVGASSGYQARLYEEREKKRTSKASGNWERFSTGIYEKLFACVQQNAPKLDDQVVSRMIRSAEGEISTSDVMNFLNGPLDFGVDVLMKHGSMSTKSHATQVADIQEAMQLPQIAERAAADPGMLDSYLEFLGIDVLRDVSAVHRDRARKENSAFMDMVYVKDPSTMMGHLDDMPVVLWEDDDMQHSIEHRRDFVKNYDKIKRNPMLLRMWATHMAHHEQNHKAKIQEQSIYVASQTQGMVERASEQGSQPKNLIQELKNFQMVKQAQAEAAAGAGGVTRSGPPPDQNEGE